MDQLMPILKPAGYRKDIPFFFKESLLTNTAAPVVAYGRDKGSHIEYDGTESESDFQTRFPPCKAEALENLKKVIPNIEFQEIEGTKIAFVTGHEYACEKIIDVEFMKDLSEQLGDLSLMVGVPFKGHMIAASSSSNLRDKLPPVIQKYYDNPQQEVISPYTFLVESGTVIGMGGENLPDDEGTNFGISENFKTNNFTVNVSCTSIDELKEIVNTTYQRILLTVMKNNKFGGEIHYQLAPTLPLTDALKSRCLSFVEQIKSNEMAQTLVAALTKSGINPIFSHDGQQIAPEMSEADKNTLEEALNNVASAKTVESAKPEKGRIAVTQEETDELLYAKMSLQELDQVFYGIVSVPNARTHVPSLEKIVLLMAEYEKRGTVVPTERPKSRTDARPPSSGSQTKKGPWWKFW